MGMVCDDDSCRHRRVDTLIYKNEFISIAAV